MARATRFPGRPRREGDGQRLLLARRSSCPGGPFGRALRVSRNGCRLTWTPQCRSISYLGESDTAESAIRDRKPSGTRRRSPRPRARASPDSELRDEGRVGEGPGTAGDLSGWPACVRPAPGPGRVPSFGCRGVGARDDVAFRGSRPRTATLSRAPSRPVTWSRALLTQGRASAAQDIALGIVPSIQRQGTKNVACAVAAFSWEFTRCAYGPSAREKAGFIAWRKGGRKSRSRAERSPPSTHTPSPVSPTAAQAGGSSPPRRR